MKLINGVKSWLLAGMLAMGSLAQASIDVNGVAVEETVKVANSELKLNGAGIRTKLFAKVYVAALYVSEPRTTTKDVLALNGPKRVSMTMLRELSSDTLSQALLDGLNHNCSDEEKARFFNQMLAIGQLFGAYRSIKPKDVMTVDWIPNTGTVVQLNGKKLGEPMPDADFYNALLKIWLGDRPADSTLKKQMLGGK
ncbi:chalcone isomerase family protein [Chitinimonas sp.]|uniref:chalcone isomerase family protein n=1 Tax=Chitinimonas sp. TaxID=1934313 RepID=UPI0035AE36FE